MKRKKILLLLCAILLATLFPVVVFAEQSTDWPQFLGQTDSQGAASIALPEDTAEEVWSAVFSQDSGWGEYNSAGSPILLGNSLYMTLNTGKLLKLNASSGELELEAECPNIPPYFSQIASDGTKIFVAQEYPEKKSVRVSAYSAETLEFLWQTEDLIWKADDSTVLSTASPLYTHGDAVYISTYFQDSSYNYAGGTLVSIRTEDGSINWEYTNTSAGYYWNGPVCFGENVISVDTSGTLRVLSAASGIVIDRYVPFESGSCSGSVNLCKNRVYFNVNNLTEGSAHAISCVIEEDGIAEGNTVISSDLGSGYASTPVARGDYVYVTNGGYGSTEAFSILDSKTLEILYRIDGIHSQSSPLLYAKDKETTIYVADYGRGDENYLPMEGSSKIYAIKHCEGSEPSCKVIFTPTAKKSQFCSQSLIPGPEGQLYYWNDGGNFFALKATDKIVSFTYWFIAGGIVLALILFTGILYLKHRNARKQP